MAHFAKLDDNNKVIGVHVLGNNITTDSQGVEDENRGINYLNKIHKYPKWKQTSYNTYGGVHNLGGTPLRKNYAGIGFTYDEAKDAFISPQPYASWTLNENTCLWDAPVPIPDDGKRYGWNEETGSWDLFSPPA
jgi:hypothetical protein